MAYLTREEFEERARASVPLRPVNVPRLGGSVGVRAMIGGEFASFMEERAAPERDEVGALAFARKWVARLVVDEGRNPIFSGPDDPGLLAMSVVDLFEFSVAVFNASGARDDGDDEGKA